MAWDTATVVCLLAAVVVCAPALVWLAGEYTESIWRNGHGLFLPVIVFCLARSDLREANVPWRSDPTWAAPLLVVSVFLAWLGANTGIGQLGALGVLFMVPGLCLLTMGREATRRIAFPLALLLFLFPMPEGLVDPLGMASATTMLAEPMLHAVGVAGYREQTVFASPQINFGVAANCSGVSTFYAGVLLAVLLGRHQKVWVRVAVLAAVWPITVVVNAARVTFLLAGAAKWGVGFVHTPLHGLSGIGTFWVVMAGVAIVGLALRRKPGVA